MMQAAEQTELNALYTAVQQTQVKNYFNSKWRDMTD